MVQFLYLALYDVLRRKAQRGEAAPRWLATAIGIPWVTVFSSIAALAGWAVWVAQSESARRSTHSVVAGFGLSLRREPWPLWAPFPVSCVTLPLLAVLCLTSWARQRIQRRVAAGGPPFCVASPSESGSESGSYTPSTRRGTSPRAYFASAAAAATGAWLVQAWLVSLLVCVGVWAAAVRWLHAATQAVKPYSSALTTAASAAAVAEGAARTFSSVVLAREGDDGDGLGRGGWGPGGFCPPSCVDLSIFSFYLGDDTCCCNTIGGVFAAAPHSAAASRSLTLALLGLGLLWAALSWLLLSTGCQIAHTESEVLLCSETTCEEEAGQRGEPAGQAAVQRLSSWLALRLDGSGSGGDGGREGDVYGMGQAGARDPLLAGGLL